MVEVREETDLTDSFLETALEPSVIYSKLPVGDFIDGFLLKEVVVPLWMESSL